MTRPQGFDVDGTNIFGTVRGDSEIDNVDFSVHGRNKNAIKIPQSGRQCSAPSTPQEKLISKSQERSKADAM